MESIQIKSGALRVAINGDPDRVLVFNPHDAGFADRFYQMIDNIQREQERLDAWAACFQQELDTESDPVEAGRTVNRKEKEVLDLLRKEIDAVFGAGSSQTAFGDTCDFDMVCQLLEGLTPIVRKARAERMARYQKRASSNIL